MENRSYRSLFWPIILIGIGVIWLLGEMNIIPNMNFGVLASMWPIILIIIGLDILIGRRSAVGGAIVGLIAVGIIVIILVAGPSLGLSNSSVLKTETIAAEIGDAREANIRLDLSSQPLKIYALSDTTSLIKGEIDYYGSLHFSESGNPVRQVTLNQVGNGSWNFGWDSNALWDIGLTPNLPIDLTINGGSGSANLDLSDIQLVSFSMDQGSGSLTIDLPASDQPYTARLNGGSGSMTMNLPADGDITLRLSRGSGSTNLNIPNGAAVRLEVRNAGSGSVNVPDQLRSVRSFGNGKEGEWETSNFQTAAHKITIICDDLGSGSFNIH